MLNIFNAYKCIFIEYKNTFLLQISNHIGEHYLHFTQNCLSSFHCFKYATFFMTKTAFVLVLKVGLLLLKPKLH